MTPSESARRPFGLTLGAGIALLGLAAVLLAAGGSWLSSDPTAVSLWTLLIGLFVVLVALVLALLPAPATAVAAAPRPVPVPAPATSFAPPVRPEEIAEVAEAPEALDEVLEAPEVPVAPSVAAVVTVPAGAMAEPPSTPEPLAPTPVSEPARVEPPPTVWAIERASPLVPPDPTAPSMAARRLPATSIPGAYLQSLGDRGSRTTEGWSEVAPPIAAALPFSPGMQRRPEAPAWSEDEATDSESPRLELELARLRARLRELETPAVGPRAGLTAAAAVRSPEPPAPPRSITGARPSCVGCGSGVDAASPKLLCWGCGRLVCAACYWRFGPGPSVHRCPDCAAKAEAATPVTISGGRGAPSPGPMPASAPLRPR